MAWPFTTFASLDKLQGHFLEHHQVLVLAAPGDLPQILTWNAFHINWSRAQSNSVLTNLLDYDQEHALKLDLNLPQAGRQSAQDFHLRVINGVAGSAKTGTRLL